MDKIRKFDRQWKQVHENDFLLGKICAGVEWGCGMLCMLIPVSSYKHIELSMWLGCILCAAGVHHYMQLYLSVKENDKWVPIRNKLQYMPVDMHRFRKVRMEYLNRICIWLAVPAFLLHQLVSYLNHSFGWKSVLFAAVWGLFIWLINGITIFAEGR